MSKKEINEAQYLQKKDDSQSNKKIAAGVVAGYLYLILKIVSGFLFVPLISKHFGQSVYGVYTLSTSFVGLFMIDIGLSALANRYLAQYRAMGKIQEINSLLGLIYKIYILLSAVAFLAFFIGYFFIGFAFAGLNPDELVLFKEMYVISSLASVFCFGMQGFDGVLNAYEEYFSIKMFSIAERSIYIIFCSLAMYFDWSIVAIAAIYSCSSLVCYIGKYFVIRFRTKCKADFKSNISKEMLKELLSFSVWNLVVSICYRLSNYLASPILGIVSNSNNIAIYSVGAEIETYAFMISGVLNGLFIPKISRIFALYESDERKIRLTKLAKEVGLLVSSLFMIMLIGFACCGQEFIDVWMQDEGYSASYWVAVILMFGQALCAPLVITNNALWFNKNIKYVAITRISSLGVFVILGFALGYFYGAIGLAISVSCGLVVRFALGIYLSKVRLGMYLADFLCFTFVRQIPAWIILLLVGFSIHFFVPLSNIYRLIICACSISILAVPLYWFAVFPRYFRFELVQLLRSKKAKKTKI